MESLGIAKRTESKRISCENEILNKHDTWANLNTLQWQHLHCKCYLEKVGMQGSGIPQHSRNYYHKNNGNMAPMIFTLFSGKRFIAILMFNCFSKMRVNNWLKKMDKISHKLRFCVHLTENTKLHLVNRKNNLPACHKHAECPICT